MLVYSGKLDYVCNYFGGRAWTQTTKWHGQVILLCIWSSMLLRNWYCITSYWFLVEWIWSSTIQRLDSRRSCGMPPDSVLWFYFSYSCLLCIGRSSESISGVDFSWDWKCWSSSPNVCPKTGNYWLHCSVYNMIYDKLLNHIITYCRAIYFMY